MRRSTSPPSSPSPQKPAGPASLLSYAELSAWLNIPISTLRSMVHRGQLPAVRLSARTCRFDRETIAQWIESSRTVCGGDS